MNVDTIAAARAARRAYELGRLRIGSIRAAVYALAFGVIARFALHEPSPAWPLAIFVLFTVIEWRGGALRAGCVRGLLAGVVIGVLPLTWLRPCCSPGMALGDGACCADPRACMLVGAAIGLVAAATMPSLRGRRQVEAAVGLALGASTVLAIRCAALIAGEAAGLGAGVLGGIAVASLARAWIAGRAASS